MVKANPAWDAEIETTIVRDPHVSKHYGFELEAPEANFSFESGLVYTSQADAEQAAEDALSAARSYQAACLHASKQR